MEKYGIYLFCDYIAINTTYKNQLYCIQVHICSSTQNLRLNFYKLPWADMMINCCFSITEIDPYFFLNFNFLFCLIFIVAIIDFLLCA